MNHDSNFPNNPTQPPNPNPTPQNPIPPYQSNDHELNTRKILYLVAFIFSILMTILEGIVGITMLAVNSTIAAAQSNGEPLIFAMIATTYIIVGVIFLATMVWQIIATVLIGRYRAQIGTPEEKQHLAFAICVLIFGNLVAGILLIVASCLMPPNKR